MSFFGKHFTIMQLVSLVALLVIFSMQTTIIIDVNGWVIGHDSSGFRMRQSSIQFLSRQPTAGSQLYQKPKKNDQQRHQSKFFFNTTRLYYKNDSCVDSVALNDTIPLSPSPSPSMEVTTSATGTFGDIMSPTINDADLLFQDGLVTSETYSLKEIYGISNPLDRMAVTANGNLQRLFSSYYDAPIIVEMVYCVRQNRPKAGTTEGMNIDAAAIWDRRVSLEIFGNQSFCTADSIVEVHNREVEDMIESGKVGIGQIFRHFNILPEFTLLAAGPTADGGFWRNYTLESEMVTCSIREVFCKNVWELSPTSIETGE